MLAAPVRGVPVHGRGQEASAKNASVGVGRPVHGAQEASAKGVIIGTGRPVLGVPVHGVQEASARDKSVRIGRHVHGVGEADARGERELVLAAPSGGSPPTRCKRPVPEMRVFVSAVPSTG